MMMDFSIPAKTRVMPQFWCDGCNQQTWMLTLDEAAKIWADAKSSTLHLSDAGNGRDQKETPQLHIHTEAQMICLKSLFPNAFSFH